MKNKIQFAIECIVFVFVFFFFMVGVNSLVNNFFR